MCRRIPADSGQHSETAIMSPERVSFSRYIPFAMEELLFDPQTSGGLLFAVKKEEAAAFERELKEAKIPAAIVGRFTEKKKKISM